MTSLAVTDLGLELRGVPQAEVDAAQALLAAGTVTPGQARALLRPFCGPEQEAAEEIAAAFLDRHVLGDAPDPAAAWYGAFSSQWCPSCNRPFPCPPVAADLLVLGVYQ